MKENGTGGSSPGLPLQPRPVDGLAVEPRRRPGLEPTHRETEPLDGLGQAHRRPLADPARPESSCSPMWMRPRRNVPVVITTAPADELPAIAKPDAGPRAVRDEQVVDLAFDDIESLAVSRSRALHGAAIELAVGLGPGPAHRRPLPAVEHAELDAGPVRGDAHDAVERVDLADQVALADAADRRDCRTSRRPSRRYG